MNHDYNNGDAIATAIRWIATTPHSCRAAFLGGSMPGADSHLPYQPTSDIDCYLVVAEEPPDGKIGKIAVEGVLLDVSWLPWQQLTGAESNAVLASLLYFGMVVADDDGALMQLQLDIRARFAEPEMVAIRLNDMRARIHRGLAGDSSRLPEPEHVMNWLFPATLATHLPLVAACAPLTVRKRFLAARQVMPATAYESLLRLYGFADVSPSQAQRWLDDTSAVFAAAAPVAATSSRFWASDVQETARGIAIGGSQELIDAGHHREALYWIVATRTRCLTLLHDAGRETNAFLPSFTAMTTALGIATARQRADRGAQILRWIDAWKPEY